MATERIKYPGQSVALEYLFGHGIEVQSTNDRYLRRLYSDAVRANKAQIEFDRERARGHTGDKVKKIPTQKNVPSQYRVGTASNPPTPDDLQRLLNKANPVVLKPSPLTMQQGKRNRKAQGPLPRPLRRNEGPMNGSITGLIEYRKKGMSEPILEVRTLSFRSDAKSIENLIAAYPNDMVELARAMTGLDWKEVYSINLIAY